MEQLKQALEELYKFDRHLLGSGYDNAMTFLGTLIDLDIKEFETGTKLGTWTVPEEWIVKEAWLKKDGRVILDYKDNPLCLVDYSLPFKGKVTREELAKHIYRHEDSIEATPYTFKFYDRDWGFSMPNVELEDGEYEVCIDTKFRDGIMSYGVHTIKGESDREIVLLAHLDHPFQANDNLSGVICLLDLANKLKCKHTIKIVFCPETIGSQAYMYKESTAKIDFVIAVDICGNDAPILLQKSWDPEDRINRVAHCALQMAAKQYRKGKFRTSIGSDETAFNDPLVGIPGLLLTRWPYSEYHSDKDTPDKIDYGRIVETGELIQKIIEIYEKDYIPHRKFLGPMMRSRYGIQSPVKVVNLNWDYFCYSMDGKKSLAELCAEYEMPFDQVYETMEKIIEDGQIKRISFNTR